MKTITLRWANKRGAESLAADISDEPTHPSAI